MIAKLTGTVVDILSRSVIVDVANVGYEAFMTSAELQKMNVGEPQTLYIAENIKEDEYTLYGFLNIESRAMYFQLTSVSGVGPKAAMSILGDHSTAEVSEAILRDNISLFSGTSGIGKKTAQRIILDLKGKLVELDNNDDSASANDPAYQALMSLGLTARDAKAALSNVSSTLPTQARVKEALKRGSK